MPEVEFCYLAGSRSGPPRSIRSRYPVNPTLNDGGTLGTGVPGSRTMTDNKDTGSLTRSWHRATRDLLGPQSAASPLSVVLLLFKMQPELEYPRIPSHPCRSLTSLRSRNHLTLSVAAINDAQKLVKYPSLVRGTRETSCPYECEAEEEQ